MLDDLPNLIGIILGLGIKYSDIISEASVILPSEIWRCSLNYCQKNSLMANEAMSLLVKYNLLKNSLAVKTTELTSMFYILNSSRVQ